MFWNRKADDIPAKLTTLLDEHVRVVLRPYNHKRRLALEENIFKLFKEWGEHKAKEALAEVSTDDLTELLIARLAAQDLGLALYPLGVPQPEPLPEEEGAYQFNVPEHFRKLVRDEREAHKVWMAVQNAKLWR